MLLTQSFKTVPLLETVNTLNESTPEILNEGYIDRLSLDMQGFFMLTYDYRLSQQIIDSYINDFRLEELKDYMFKLYLLSIEEKPSGIVETLKFMLSEDNRRSYYQYKSKIKQQLTYGETAISSITKRKFKFNSYAEIRLAKLESDSNAQKAIRSANAAGNSNAFNSEEASEFFNFARWATGVFTASSVLEKIAGILGHFLNFGMTMIGWTVKIMIFFMFQMLMFIF